MIQGSLSNSFSMLFYPNQSHKNLQLYTGTKKKNIVNKMYQENNLAKSKFEDIFAEYKQNPQPFVSSSLIAECRKNGDLEKAFDIYNILLNHPSQTPHLGVFKAMINACIQLNHHQLAVPIWDDMSKFNIKMDKICFGMMAGVAAKTANSDLADKLLKKITDAGSSLSIDVMDCTQLIQAFTRGGNIDGAFQVLELLDNRRIKPNAVTYTCLLTNCKDLEIGKRIHQHLINRKIEWTKTLETALLHMYSQAGSWKDAWSIFSKMKTKDSVAWSAMISACRNNEYGLQAITLFNQMQKEGIKADNITYISMLSVCANLTAISIGKQIHKQIEAQKIKTEVSLENALVHMYAKCGEPSTAKSIFDRIKCKDVISWNAIINGYSLNGLGMDGFTLFQQMEKEGIKPNNVTFVSLLNGFR
jgi:pentatricopeptide repeat protein